MSLSILDSLSDDLLIVSYRKAVEFGVCEGFLGLLYNEIKDRGIRL